MSIDPGYYAILIAYILGSIPFGLLLTKLAGLGDVRKQGSGNIGATNVLRTGNKGLAVATLLLDIGKGAGAVFIALKLDPAYAGPAALVAFLGHVFPLWLKFKGGKGVATYVGGLLALNWMVGLIALSIWIMMAAVFRISSLSSLTAALAGPVATWFLSGQNLTLWVGLMSLLIFFAHRANISRLLQGAEPKIGKK